MPLPDAPPFPDAAQRIDLLHKELIAAAQCGPLAHMLACVQEGADKNYQAEDGNSALICLSQCANPAPLAEWIALGVDLELSDTRGQTALMHACERKDAAALVKILIDAGADIHHARYNGDTPLLCAMRGGDPQAAKLLCEHGARLDAKNFDHMNAAHLACQLGKIECLKVLGAFGFDFASADKDGFSMLFFATQGRDPGCVSFAIEAGCPIDTKHGTFGWTALMRAVQDGNAPMAKILLEAGAHPNVVDTMGNSALSHAVRLQNEPLVSLILAFKPRLDLKNDEGQSALSIAAGKGDSAILDLLLRAGALAKDTDHGAWPPIMIAAHWGAKDNIKALLQYGADPNHADSQGTTPLMRAASVGSAPALLALLDAGALWHLKNSKGETAEDCATCAPHSPCQALLAAVREKSELSHAIPKRSSTEPSAASPCGKPRI